MARPYVIYTDASADVDKSFFEKKGVGMVPMGYTLGEQEQICANLESEETLKAFYDMQRGGNVTHTSQIIPQKYIEIFEPVLREGKDVLYLALSSGLTKTVDSANLAKQELAETVPGAVFFPVDSLAGTAGMGLLLEKAVENMEKGMTLQENAAWLEENRLRVCHWFMVEDLMYLKRGGRIPATTAVLGTALNIKPILKIDEEGKLITIDKKRGEKMAVKNLFDRYMESRDSQFGERVYIVHADCPHRADMLEKKILEANPQAQITKMYLSPIIGAHTGPGMMALIHFGKR